MPLSWLYPCEGTAASSQIGQTGVLVRFAVWHRSVSQARVIIFTYWLWVCLFWLRLRWFIFRLHSSWLLGAIDGGLAQASTSSLSELGSSRLLYINTDSLLNLTWLCLTLQLNVSASFNYPNSAPKSLLTCLQGWWLLFAYLHSLASADSSQFCSLICSSLHLTFACGSSSLSVAWLRGQL